MEAPSRAGLGTLPDAERLNKIIDGLNSQVRAIETLSTGVT
ncbi:hypothetical protein ACFFMR_11835 [Micromonospora andamanensis]|nr:hypothetical protein [Micromonospora andamanensis]